MLEINKVHCGDCLSLMKDIPDESINCCVTSPPYWGLRDYGVDGQLGLEKTPEEYVDKLVKVFMEVKRVLRSDGTLWLNLGDTYAASRSYQVMDNKYKDVGNKIGHSVPPGLKPKDLVGIPWRVAFALQADGWWLRQDIIWAKPNPMPESVTDRCTKSHEYIFLLSKSAKYYYDNEAIGKPIKESTIKRYERSWDGDGNRNFPGGPQNHLKKFMDPENNKRAWSNKRSVWTVNTKPFKKAHFATFPPKLIEPCILAGCPKDGVVLDPFSGAGTTAFVSSENNRNFIGLELNQSYIDIANQRILQAEPQLDFKEAK